MKTLKLMYLVLFVALFVGACAKKDDATPSNTNPTPNPTGSLAVANFTFTPTTGAAPLQVQFTNTSTNAVAYLWEFGNGQTSTVANATTTYATAGTYTIKLTATGADGKTNAKTASITVTAPPPPVVQTYEFKDKWISAGGPEPKSYRNHHYTFQVNEEIDFKATLTSSVNVALYIYNELDILGGQTDGYSSSASLTGKLKAGKYRVIVAGVKGSEANYVLTFTGKFAAKPEKVTSQYQQIIGKWLYSNRDEAMSASNRHYDIEVTQDSQLDIILNSSADVKIHIINELGFQTNFGNGTNATLADISLKKGKYRVIASTTYSGIEANFILNIFGQFANVTEIKSIEQQLTGSWTSASTLSTSPNNPKYNIEITQDSMLDAVLFAANGDVYPVIFILNDKGDIVGSFISGSSGRGIRGTINLKKGIYTIVPATRRNGDISNFQLTVFGHHISNFRLK